MARRPTLCLLALAVAGALAVLFGIVVAVGLPAVVGGAAALVTASHAWAHEPEQKSRGEQAPTLLTLVVVLAFTCALLTPLLLLAGPSGRAAAAPGLLAGLLVTAVIGIAVGWSVGGLLPGSGWRRAGCLWRKGE